MAELVIKYKWFIFAVILCWSFALAGRLYVENAHAETIWSPTNMNYIDQNFSREAVFQEFTAAGQKYNKLKIRWSGAERLSTSTISICSGAFSAINTCNLVVMEQLLGRNGASSTDGYTEYFFSTAFNTTPGNKYFFKIQNVPDWVKVNYDYANHAGGGWQNSGTDLYTSVDLQFAIGYDNDLVDLGTYYDSVEIYDNPFFERHHLEVPALQYCANDNSAPCQINFSWNDRSWQSGVKLYNDNEDGTLGSYISSTTPLEFYPTLSGNISLPHTATTTEGYDYYCLRLYSAYGTYPDEITCGIKVLFVSPSTITCAWEKARYEVENDEGKICEGIATSSAWEVGSWPGAMECAGKKIGYWLFTASSSDYYSFCKATLATSERFPLNLVYSFKSKIFDLASSTRPATTTQVMLPLIWKGATTTTDLLPLASARAKGGAAFETLYTWLEIFIWLYAAWLIMSDLFGITLRTKERIANESFRQAYDDYEIRKKTRIH